MLPQEHYILFNLDRQKTMEKFNELIEKNKLILIEQSEANNYRGGETYSVKLGKFEGTIQLSNFCKLTISTKKDKDEDMKRIKSFIKQYIICDYWRRSEQVQINGRETSFPCAHEKGIISVIKIEQIEKTLKEVQWVFDFQNIPIEYIASHPDVRIPPEQTLNILYSLDWHKPSEEGEKEFERKFKFMGELAWQYKYEKDKLLFPPDKAARCELEKRITRFLEIYPNEVRNPHERGV